MVALKEPAEQRLVLYGVSWDTYESLLRDLDCRSLLRLTYDDGALEIMTLGHERENYNELLGRMVVMVALELDIAIHSGGSTTMRRKLKKRGLEPDRCYWIQHEAQMRGRKTFDIRRDPPPDLALEVDISRGFLDRMAIYASVRIPEVWRYYKKTIQVYQLTSEGKYKIRASSLAFPFLPVAELLEFLKKSHTMDETRLMRSFVAWVRDQVLPAYQAYLSTPKGKKQQRNGNHQGRSG